MSAFFAALLVFLLALYFFQTRVTDAQPSKATTGGGKPALGNLFDFRLCDWRYVASGKSFRHGGRQLYEKRVRAVLFKNFQVVEKCVALVALLFRVALFFVLKAFNFFWGFEWKMVKVAINGFGRIGRNFVRAALERGLLGKDIELVAVNDITDAPTLAHLLKYDSVHGVIKNVEIKAADKAIEIGGRKVAVLAERDPQALPWKNFEADVVLESTGLFTDRESAGKHLSAGAKKVLISAPAKNPDATLVLGVNDSAYDKAKHNLVSMASCTTNCLAPVAKTLNDSFGIEQGFMTTCHAYTNDQRILDLPHKDLRRARAAAISIIPTSTGAAAAIGEVIPQLKGRLNGLSLRVPIPCGSINDFTCTLSKPASVQEINDAIKSNAQGAMKGILEYSQEPLVSQDIIDNPASSIFDAESTLVISADASGKGTFVKTLAWYDNEWGYSNRLVDLSLKLL